MTLTVTARRRLTRRQVRDLQCAAHLLAALVLVVYVYVAPLLGAGSPRPCGGWSCPALAVSGMALWQWHRLRATLRMGKG